MRETVFTGLRGAGAKFDNGPAGDNLVAGRRWFGKGGTLAIMVGKAPPGKQTRRLDGSMVEPANQFTGESTRLRNLPGGFVCTIGKGFPTFKANL